MATKNICIWGDSITYGAWDTEGGWVDRLRRHLHERTIASGFDEYFWVYNLGIPGDTTDDILQRIDAECRAREPHISIFAAGINDSSRLAETGLPRVSVERLRKNASALIRRVREVSEAVFWIGLGIIDESAVAAEQESSADFRHQSVIEHHEALARVCLAEHVPYLDMLNVLAPEDLIDGLHPNAVGHQKMFEHIRDFLVAQGVLAR
ncbi:MAG: GDSL-type esterase/lipase family protein [bacterium]|nr:GDSL-type esterase/lipase family protein [bacterium]MDZ4284223.1 GDSL-type esterase/lipase family protein [Patescibacteria group bacterium]